MIFLSKFTDLTIYPTWQKNLENLKKLASVHQQLLKRSPTRQYFTSKYSSPTSQNFLQIYSSLESIIKKSKYLDWRTSNVKGIKSRVTVNCSLPLALISKLLDSTEAIKSTNNWVQSSLFNQSIHQSNPIQSNPYLPKKSFVVYQKECTKTNNCRRVQSHQI